MAYNFINDGGPDAEDYYNNYFHVDTKSTDTVTCIIHILCTHDIRNPQVGAELHELCQASYLTQMFSGVDDVMQKQVLKICRVKAISHVLTSKLIRKMTVSQIAGAERVKTSNFLNLTLLPLTFSSSFEFHIIDDTVQFSGGPKPFDL